MDGTAPGPASSSATTASVRLQLSSSGSETSGPVSGLINEAMGETFDSVKIVQSIPSSFSAVSALTTSRMSFAGEGVFHGECGDLRGPGEILQGVVGRAVGAERSLSGQDGVVGGESVAGVCPRSTATSFPSGPDVSKFSGGHRVVCTIGDVLSLGTVSGAGTGIGTCSCEDADIDSRAGDSARGSTVLGWSVGDAAQVSSGPVSLCLDRVGLDSVEGSVEGSAEEGDGSRGANGIGVVSRPASPGAVKTIVSERSAPVSPAASEGVVGGGGEGSERGCEDGVDVSSGTVASRWAGLRRGMEGGDEVSREIDSASRISAPPRAVVDVGELCSSSSVPGSLLTWSGEARVGTPGVGGDATGSSEMGASAKKSANSRRPSSHHDCTGSMVALGQGVGAEAVSCKSKDDGPVIRVDEERGDVEGERGWWR